ncbi:formate dehydrogenase subunit gamma [Propylenella binzhouense]|uniref:Formate dehydrogenase subunit gamma n=1 Tax=Propylenella binzhouense TaxID=2555902 RepID=A0A964T9I9_9HYPH|nr:formate dehydrogenase subunit gamma [Propylenella binzhouense]MYZ50372.1 formate dehydrogenase subunit gamma [Propylenella binzhouense]
MSFSKRMRLILPLLAALVLGAGLFAYAPPSGAQGVSGSNPTAQSVNERQLLEEMKKIQGRVTIPNTAAGLLEQPQGRDYRGFREGALPWIGGILILGMLAALALFYFAKGRMRMTEGYAGVKILRFNVFERFNHWMTATAFIVLAITGLNYVFGKRLLMPLMSPEAFATWSAWAKLAHNFVSWVFILGLLFMLVVWIKDNIPDRYDWRWLREGGGFLRGTHPPAGRFNAGQKLIYWSVILGGIAMSASGVLMLFPFSFTDINGMQWAQYVHATIGMVLIAVIIAHIYIGTLGMEGAYDAMGRGEVDLNWARAHHSAWVEKQEARVTGARAPHPAPAE